MNAKLNLEDATRQIVYVKSVDVAELPREVQKEATGHDTLFALHDADGQQLALVADKSLALMLARQNDLTPVALH